LVTSFLQEIGLMIDKKNPVFSIIFYNLFLSLLLFLYIPLLGKENKNDPCEASLKESLKGDLISSSLDKQIMTEASSNITVITREMIERRGYQNLVDICQDIPGFDFATFEDGGGEYPIHSINRGIGGDPGNAKILIIIDGVVQNFISFNWSLLWTNEQILHDVERIEIIQGPGSLILGANAYSGIIHVFTRKHYEGLHAKVWYGQHNTRALDFQYGAKIKKTHFSLAFRKFISDGDGGVDRFDPGNYFHNIVAPSFQSSFYDANGDYIENTANPTAGQAVPDGFNTSKDDTAVRLKLSIENGEIGFFFWDKKDGLGSYVPGYEYYTNDPNKLYQAHHRGYHVYGKHDLNFSSKLSLKSTLIYRITQQMPDTGFVYTYKFNTMAKTYHSFNSQGSVEERLYFTLDNSNRFIGGFRLMTSLKMPQIVSLNQIQDQYSSTTISSYNQAARGECLYQSESVTTLNTKEYAAYLLWDSKFSKHFSSSIGMRYDHSSEYGSTLNPHLGFIVKPVEKWNLKLLYGSAFRQPGIFELTDEWRKNPDLEPEKIGTYEIENNLSLTEQFNIKANIFYSVLSDFIAVVSDPNRPGGQRYDNIGRAWVRGLSFAGDFYPFENLYLYANYIYTQGKEKEGGWKEIDNIALHKLNFGLNMMLFNDHLNVNFRANCVGKRKAPESNMWLQNHENGYAPSYFKANLVLTLKRLFKNINITPQIVIKNIFDAEYYGIGRQTGEGNRDVWNPVTNPNPPGFVPAYHPQPGRTFMINIKYSY